MPPIKTREHHPPILPPEPKKPAAVNQPTGKMQPCVEEPKNSFGIAENMAMRDGILRNDARFDLEAKLFAAQNNQTGAANNQASNANTGGANNTQAQTGRLN